MNQEFAIYILGAVTVVSNLFWAVQCHKLMNKFMCKDFGEYQYYKGQAPKQSAQPTHEEKIDLAEIERENESYLNELNGMMLPK